MTSRPPTRAAALPAAALLATLSAPGCAMQETVRDSHGNVIYSGPVDGSIHDSDEERAQRILEKEWEMGYSP